MGRATALVEANAARTASSNNLTTPDNGDRTLLRLTLVTRDFPNYPGACAHLARYMMQDRVRLIRAELAGPTHPSAAPAPRPDLVEETMPARTLPTTHRDVRLMEWVLWRGEQIEPDNAFWPAMLATTYFAAARDEDALRELRRLNHTARWDAYLYEEILGQWRLYSLAYGDHGAAQKIGPLSFIAFPHLREIRHMAQLARWYAEREAQRGHLGEALQIRRSVARLGRTIRETSAWAYEALYGTDLVLIAYSDGDSAPTLSGVQTVAEWKPKAVHFLDLLTRHQRRGEIRWVYEEIEASCKLRQAVNLARADTSYPGIPPGIPLAALFGDWMAGISLIQQCLAMSVCALLAAFWLRWVRSARRARADRLLLPALLVLTALDSGLLFLGVPSERMASAFLISTSLAALLALDRLFFLRRRMRRDTAAKDDEVKTAPLYDTGTDETKGERLWGTAATVRILLLLLAPGLIALALLRPTLSGLHPVAILLTRWFGSAVPPSSGEMLRIALLAGALPLAIALVAGLWGLARDVQPTTAALVGLRRTALPALACLAIVYLLLLQRTLMLDTRTSHAINEAARNDRQWVLTHTAEEESP